MTNQEKVAHFKRPNSMSFAILMFYGDLCYYASMKMEGIQKLPYSKNFLIVNIFKKRDLLFSKYPGFKQKNFR